MLEIFIAGTSCFIVGLVFGFFAGDRVGTRETEQRWAETVERGEDRRETEQERLRNFQD